MNTKEQLEKALERVRTLQAEKAQMSGAGDGTSAIGDDDVLLERFGSVSTRRACVLLGVGHTRLYELMNSEELESYKEGKSRRITIRSIAARRKKLLAANSTGNAA
jgi:hypothetical protein